MKLITAAVVSLLALSAVGATTYKREEGTCFPLSSMKFGAENKSLNGLSEFDYNQILDRVQTIMGPEIKKRMNKNLVIDR
ncbi:MAG: hypothetical protein EHM20_04075, partial [Alphaproteobacteria bacterium]